MRLEALEDRLSPATLTVTSTADTANPNDPYLSLRQAIAIVNSLTLPGGLSSQIQGQISGALHEGGTDTIEFDTTRVTTPIRLGGTQLELSLPGTISEITIIGGGVVAVDGANATRVFQVDPGVEATLAHMGIVRGYAAGPGEASFGGAVYNRGTLTMTYCNLDGDTSVGGVGGGLSNNGGDVTVIDTAFTNDAAVGGNGGGLYNSANGNLTVTDSLFRGDTAQGYGGGIYNQGGSLIVNECTLTGNSVDFTAGGIGGAILNANSGTLVVANSVLSGNSANYGGGIDNDSGSLTLTNTTVSFNTASFDGGGLYSDRSALTVTDCHVVSNSAAHGGGIYNTINGTSLVAGSSFSANHSDSHEGGGIYNAGLLTVTRSTLSANTAGSGGGIENLGTLTVTNSTLSANSASRSGGGIASSGMLTVTSSTLSGNSAGSGGGLYNDATRPPSLLSTIVAGNTSPAGTGPDIYGSVDSSSNYNLVGIADSTLTGISNGVAHNQIGSSTNPLDPGLLPLGDYGGPTYTMALLPGSLALDAGDPGQAGASDQRGVTRTGGVNLGAFQASAVLLVVYAPATVTAGVPFDVRVAAFDPFGLTDFGYTGTVTLSISDPQVGLIDTHTFSLADAGSFTFSAISTTAAPQTLTASAGTLTATADLTVLPGAAAFLVFVPPGPVQVGVPFSLGVAAYDTLGNLATGYTGTVEVTRGDGGDPLVSTFTAADTGQQAFSVTVSQSGLVSFFLRDRDHPGVQGDRIDLMF